MEFLLELKDAWKKMEKELHDNESLAKRIEKFCNNFSERAASGDKDVLRRLFLPAREYVLSKNRRFLEQYADKLVEHIASGREVKPNKLSPVLVPVASERDSRLFRFAALSWSVPVSPGYGRRMRFLVVDEYNEKLIGILGLCDPVFNLSCRDDWIGWNVRQREKRLSAVMSAYVLGAVPPYSYLLCGKLVALLALSNEVRAEFRDRYAGRKTIIRKVPHDGRLALLTVTSALGRSSLYNRLKIQGRTYYFKIGKTSGWGHYHLSFNGMYRELRLHLEESGDAILTKYRYGEGPNWKLRLLRRALNTLGLPEDLLRHGLEREVFAAPLGKNALEFLRGDSEDLKEYDWPYKKLFRLFRKRWLLQRAKRDQRWRMFDSNDYLKLLSLSDRVEGDDP